MPEGSAFVPEMNLAQSSATMATVPPIMTSPRLYWIPGVGEVGKAHTAKPLYILRIYFLNCWRSVLEQRISCSMIPSSPAVWNQCMILSLRKSVSRRCLPIFQEPSLIKDSPFVIVHLLLSGLALYSIPSCRSGSQPMDRADMPKDSKEGRSRVERPCLENPLEAKTEDRKWTRSMVKEMGLDLIEP